jgi:hypothetical protein
VATLQPNWNKKSWQKLAIVPEAAVGAEAVVAAFLQAAAMTGASNLLSNQSHGVASQANQEPTQHSPALLMVQKMLAVMVRVVTLGMT